MAEIDPSRVCVIPQDDIAVSVILHACAWLQYVKGETTEWWDPAVVDKDFLLSHAQPDELFVALVDSRPAAAAIIQEEQDLQDWSSVDRDEQKQAMYVHYVAVERAFASKGLVGYLMDHADVLARERGISVVRLDTNADEQKLCNVYESVGFMAVGTLQEDGHRTILYERPVAGL